MGFYFIQFIYITMDMTQVYIKNSFRKVLRSHGPQTRINCFVHHILCAVSFIFKHLIIAGGFVSHLVKFKGNYSDIDIFVCVEIDIDTARQHLRSVLLHTAGVVGITLTNYGGDNYPQRFCLLNVYVRDIQRLQFIITNTVGNEDLESFIFRIINDFDLSAARNAIVPCREEYGQIESDFWTFIRLSNGRQLDVICKWYRNLYRHYIRSKVFLENVRAPSRTLVQLQLRNARRRYHVVRKRLLRKQVIRLRGYKATLNDYRTRLVLDRLPTLPFPSLMERSIAAYIDQR